jgi:phage gpG-like protein
VEFFIKAMGVKQVSTKFTRLGQAAADAAPAMESVAQLIFSIEKTVFNSQGRRGGGSWKQDSPDWLARKIRNGQDPRINHMTLALRRSVTEPGAPGQVLEVSPASLVVGSSLPQAAPSQRNRPFIKFTVADRTAMRGVIREHLMAAWRAG